MLDAMIPKQKKKESFIIHDFMLHELILDTRTVRKFGDWIVYGDSPWMINRLDDRRYEVREL